MLFQPSPPCTFYLAYKQLAEHYGIQDKEGCCFMPCGQFRAFCAPVFSYYQILDTVLVRENLKIVMVNVAPDAAEAGKMQR